jgi:large subunit ribosomal protein L18
MNRIQKSVNNLARRKNRIRANVTGTAERPRLSVFISNRHISAQIIDDDAKTTLAQASTVLTNNQRGTMTDKAVTIGKEIATQAKKKNIKSVVFDRNGKLYHGRVKAMADAAREAGLEF